MAVAAARAWLAEHGEADEPLLVDRAFHSALLDPILDELRAAAEQVRLRPVELEFVSGLDGTAHPVGWLPDADHLVRQARQPVEFHAVLRTLAPAGPLVELGPGATLTGLARHALPDRTRCVPTQGHGGDLDGLWSAVAQLHCAGVDIDWAAVLDGSAGRRIPLPGYPFQHRSYWIGPPPHQGLPPHTGLPHTGLPHPGPAVDRVPAHQRTMEDGMTEQAILKRVLELTAAHLGYRVEELDAGRTFVGLGADSLQLIGMLRQLEGEFGARIAVREILEEASTPELTARLIAERTGQVSTEPAAVPIPIPAAAPAAAATAQERETPAAAEYASRAELAELNRQITVLAETQAAMLSQLSDAVALLTAERGR